MNNTEPIIELKNITKSFDGTVQVIDGLNLTVNKGEFVTLLGPSGCGKTTLLRMIGGFDSPTSGEILLDGKDISALMPNERPINTVFQKYALFPNLNVYENIAFGLKIKKLSKAEIKAKVSHVLEIVDLEGFEKRSIATLSGGQQQRVAIARAIVNEPEILLLDEPLGALDYKMRKEMQLELKAMHENLGITFIFVTHDQEEAMTMSDKIVVLSEGKVQQYGTPEEIYNTPQNTFVADFVGESNIFNGEVSGMNRVTFCDTEFDLKETLPVGTRIEVVIRPEDVKLTEPSQGQFKGEVTSSIFKGTYYEILVQDENYEFISYHNMPMPRGCSVGITIAKEDMHLMKYDVLKNTFEGQVQDGMFVSTDMSIALGFADIVDAAGQTVQNPENGRVITLSFDPSDAVLSDDPEAGIVQGNITTIIYKGDHYSYTVRSKSNTAYYVDDEYLWNTDDFVSIQVAHDKLTFTLDA